MHVDGLDREPCDAASASSPLQSTCPITGCARASTCATSDWGSSTRWGRSDRTCCSTWHGGWATSTRRVALAMRVAGCRAGGRWATLRASCELVQNRVVTRADDGAKEGRVMSMAWVTVACSCPCIAAVVASHATRHQPRRTRRARYWTHLTGRCACQGCARPSRTTAATVGSSPSCSPTAWRGGSPLWRTPRGGTPSQNAW